MDELVGDLFSERRHQVAMLLKEGQVFVIGASRQRVDLDGIRAPVSKKGLEHFHRQLARDELLHERRLIDPRLPPFPDASIQFIDNRLRFLGGSFLAQLNLYRHASPPYSRWAPAALTAFQSNALKTSNKR